jgi:hypothetical protein
MGLSNCSRHSYIIQCGFIHQHYLFKTERSCYRDGVDADRSTFIFYFFPKEKTVGSAGSESVAD